MGRAGQGTTRQGTVLSTKGAFGWATSAATYSIILVRRNVCRGSCGPIGSSFGHLGAGRVHDLFFFPSFFPNVITSVS